MIATDVPGCREVVLQDGTGILVPADDVGALAAAMVSLADSPELRHRYGAAARALAVSKFGASAIAKQVGAFYQRLAETHDARR